MVTILILKYLYLKIVIVITDITDTFLENINSEVFPSSAQSEMN